MYVFRVCLILGGFLTLCYGRCSIANVTSFVQNVTITGAMSIDGNPMLLTDGADNTTVISGAYIVMKCNPGYTNVGGSLNVTCVGDSWSPYPNCVLNTGSGSMTTTTVASGGNIPCKTDSTTTTIPNGNVLDSSLQLVADASVTGWIQFSCNPGYILNGAMSGLYMCTNGTWSSKPQCLVTGRCSYTQLETFIYNTTGIQTTNQSRLVQIEGNRTVVLNDSYIVLSCLNGYTNIGGPLNITCFANNTWSPFPNCVWNPGNGVVTTTTTTMSPNSDGSCPVKMPETVTVSDGYIIDFPLTLTPSGTAIGSVVFACMPGYILDPAIGATYVCKNGAWLPKPQCLMTGRCPYPALETFIYNAPGLQTTNQSQLVQIPENKTVVLSESYIVVTCLSGYKNTGGPLNITCFANSTWSQFPSCVFDVQATTTTTTTAANNAGSCPYSSDMLTLANGTRTYYYGLPTSDSGLAINGAYIDFACMYPYTLSGNSRRICINGVWSAQPVCIAPAPTTTTTVAYSTTCADVPSVANSYISTASNIQYINNKYTRQVEYTCLFGYYLVPTAGQRAVSCTNGVWDQLPVCALSPACSFDKLRQALVNVNIVSRSLNSNYEGNIIAGGWIALQCIAPYVLNPTSGSLNITCLMTGFWTPFPVCS